MEFTKSSPNEIQETAPKDGRAHRGKLKIFFGYAEGTGKTYSMLEAAHTANENGADIVVGCI